MKARKKWHISLIFISGAILLSGCQKQPLAADSEQVLEVHQETSEKTVFTDTSPIYGIGSTSKVFTAAAVMKLAQEGKLDLDHSLTEYIPEFYLDDSRYQQITPRMLLNHSSGLQGSSLSNTLLYGEADSYHHDTLLTQLRSQRLKADPGEYSVYCNDGFTLAEILVERVSKMSFTEYLTEQFWRPLGLSQIRTAQNLLAEETIATGYYQGVEPLPTEVANVIGSGGIYATAPDLSQAGQLFVDGAAILAPATLEQMEQEWYTKGYGLDAQIPSMMSFGLGWDSVASPEFARYGIRALSKGGDTNQYHSMLTVLPEYQLSGAVLSSGGSSSYNAILVQEMIAIYLEETGQLDRQTASILEPAKAAMELPAELYEYAGWYLGAGIYQISFTDEGLLQLQSHGTKRDTMQYYQYLGEGRFLSMNGAYLNAGGELVEAQAGTRGITRLNLTMESEGVYLGMVTEETLPQLGTQIINIPLAQRCAPLEIDEALKQQWEQRGEQEYLLVSEKYTSASYLLQARIRPRQYAGLTGYLGEEKKTFLTKIKNLNQTEFFQKLPGQFGRDLVDVSYYKKDGAGYLRSHYDYIDAQTIPALPLKDDQIIEVKGDTAIWYQIGADWADRSVMITAPAKGHFYVYTEVDQAFRCVSSSLLGDSGQELYLPQNGKIAFVGETGSQFQIQALMP